MALNVRLEATFTGDGSFDFAATMDDLVGTLEAADFGDVRFDPSSVLNLLSELAPPDLARVLDLAAEFGTGIGAGLGAPGVAIPTTDLLAPLERLTSSLSGFSLDSLEALGTASGADLGLPGLQARIATVTASLEDGLLAGLADLVTGAVPDVSLPDTAGALGPILDGAVNLTLLLGGLLAIESVSGKLATRAENVHAMHSLRLRESADAVLRLSSDADVVARLRAAAPGDVPTIELLGRRVVAFLDAVHVMRDEWSRSFGFGEAALVGLDVEGSAGALGAARLVLDAGRVQSVARMATEVRSGLDSMLALQLPDPAESLEAALADAFELVQQVTDIVRGIDARELTAPVTRLVEAPLAPIRELAAAVQTVGTGIETAIGAVRDVARAIDLTPIVEAVQTALHPVVTTMAAVEDLIGAGEEAIETVAGEIIAVLDDVRTAVEGVAALVRTALQGVSEIVLAIDFADLQAQVEAGIGAVVDALNSAQLSPYFDASVDVIDTTAGVVDAIPFGMLPSDLQADIVAACRPVKEIDFPAIADGISAEFDAILESLDTDVLAEIDAAYRAVVEFLASIDPRAEIEAFEAGPFEEFRNQVLSIDPSALFAPIEEALESFRSVLADLDLEERLIGPLEEGFQSLRGRLAELDPAVLLQPAREQVDGVRTDIANALHLDAWSNIATDSRTAIEAWLARVDPAALAAALSDEVAARLSAEVPATPNVLGTLVASLAQATGLPADATGMVEVLSWLRGANGRAVVEGRLAAAAGHLTATRDSVRSLDPAPVLAAAQAHHNALTAAVRAHPEGSELRVSLEGLLDGNRPGDLLSGLASNRAGYLARLDADAGAALVLSAGGFSHVTVTTDGLRDALAPLVSVLVWARTLLERLGLTTEGGPLGALLVVWLEQLGPHRVVPPLVEVVEAIRDKLVEIVAEVLAPVEEAAATIENTLGILDLGPIVDGLAAVYADVLAEIDALSPGTLLGPAVGAVDDVVDRLESFDPLAPVQAVIDELRATITSVFDTVRPSIVFADAITIYTEVVGAAQGLDVRALLDPVLAALEGLAGQLDVGLDEVAESLTRLQEALPDRVTESGLSGSVTAEVEIGL